MPKSLTVQQLTDAKAMISHGDLVGFYNYMYSQGYGYANLAKGVVECSMTSGGATALQYMTDVAKQAGITLTTQQVAKIEIAMANGYVNTLLGIASASGANNQVSRDIRGDEALAFHNDVFDKNGLPRQSWTLYTPSQYLSKEEFNQDFTKSVALGANALDSLSWLTDMFAASYVARWQGVTTGNMQKIADATAMESWINKVLDGSIQGLSGKLGLVDKIAACTAGMQQAVMQTTYKQDLMLVPQLNTNGEIVGYSLQTPTEVRQQTGGYVAYFSSGAAVVVSDNEQRWVSDGQSWRVRIHAGGNYEVCTYKDINCVNPVYKYDSGSHSSELKLDTNGDGKWDQINVAADTNNDGIADSFVSSGTNQSSLFTADKQLDALHDQGLLSNDIWNDYTSWSTSQLVNNSQTVPVTTTSDLYSPIRAFYESKSAATDTAVSIANKTFRILNSANQAVTSAQLAALDTNKDGKLTGTELNGLNAWTDSNEDGLGQSTELTTLATALANAGLSSVRSTDYAFYTAGNASFKTVAQDTALAPVNSLVAAGVPVAPASNYRTLRDTDNVYWVNSYQTASNACTWRQAA